MGSPAASADWQEELAQTHARTVEIVRAALFHAERNAAIEAGEHLNQVVRRLRRTENESGVLAIIVDSSTPFCTRAGAFLCDGQQARLQHARGFDAPDLTVDMTLAPAFWSAVETKDPVVTAANAKELSPDLCGFATDQTAHLFPVVVRTAAVAILFASGDVQASALELLCEVAAAQIESLRGRMKTEPLIQQTRGWKDLSLEQQARHLRAQRFARVKVAAMRLSRPIALRQGLERGDLYSALQPEIDSAREEYRKEFVQGSRDMVDYLYLEMLRNLANDDDSLLGQGFPGRLV